MGHWHAVGLLVGGILIGTAMCSVRIIEPRPSSVPAKIPISCEDGIPYAVIDGKKLPLEANEGGDTTCNNFGTEAAKVVLPSAIIAMCEEGFLVQPFGDDRQFIRDSFGNKVECLLEDPI